MTIKVSRVIRYVVAIVLALLNVAPIYWIIITSFKSYREAFQIPPIFFKWINFQSYQGYFAQDGLMNSLANSVLSTSLSVLVAMLFGCFAAYALSRTRLRGGEFIAFFMMATRFIPPISTVIPLFLAMRYFSLYDTVTGLVILLAAMNIPYAVWMMRGFFKEVPIEVEEAAWVDGCSRLGGFFRIVLPMCKPGLAATAVLTTLFAWNDFMYALIMTSSEARTLPMTISMFMGDQGVEWNQMAAASTVIMLPALVFSIFVQRHMARGLTFGALKG